MTLADLFLFFAGDADAIRRLAADPWTLAVGAPLVLSAGLARHHDTHDLRAQWWRLLIPFAASTLAAVLLFLVLALAHPQLATWELGRGLLGLFWLTAPFAWLYGVPFERLWPAERAATMRRIALAIVAACRVALMTRCVVVLIGCAWWAGLLLVAAFAAPTALLATGVAWILVRRPENAQGPRATPDKPSLTAAAGEVANFMGGIPLNFPDHMPVMSPPGLPREEPRQYPDAGIAVGCLAVVLLGIAAWWLGLSRFGPAWRSPEPTAGPMAAPSAAVWVAVSLAVVFWVPWLIRHQPAQRRRTMFVNRLRYGPLEETVRELASLLPADFPASYLPAAALARWDFAARLLPAAQVAADLPAGNWVRADVLHRMAQMLPVWLDPADVWLEKQDRMPEEGLRRLAELADLFRRLSEGGELLGPYQDYLTELCAYAEQHDPPRVGPLQELLALALKRGSGR